MLPQRERGGRARFVNPEEVRALQRQVQALQEELRRGTNFAAGDESEEENEEEEIRQEEEGEGEVLNQAEERLFRAISKFGKISTTDVGVFLGNLKSDELIDWINEPRQG